MIASEIGSRIGLKLVEGKAAEEMLAAVVSRAVLMVTAALLCTSLALGLQREIWLRGATVSLVPNLISLEIDYPPPCILTASFRRVTSTLCSPLPRPFPKMEAFKTERESASRRSRSLSVLR